ncbi:aliphatic sulfonate ABC transporter substrate-binding protein [Streptomyces phytophilus]|uniref:aliphatic sulfonate ABC transporter substrate-binding protein n=1 Tax=Streptomyces phytophilus TaxID=722715 RepID=UPI0015F0A02E|nr:aliphatic sulfonate ABC transporter substrate-binding protein [Streptomyces phytophilus]
MNRPRPPRRRLTGLLLALVLLPAASGCGDDSAAAGGDRSVRFGYIADYSGSAALAVAEEQGLWDAAGIEPELKVFTNGPLQVQALEGGDLDFGYLGPGALWMPASGRASIVAVNMLGHADRVIARPDTGITEPGDLRGRKVAVPEGTSGEMILDLALREAGLEPDDVEKVRMDPSTVVTAFSSGQVDAAAIWYPLVDTIEEKVPDLVEVSSTTDFHPDQTFPNVFVTRPGFAEDDPGLAREVTGVLKAAGDWIAAHPEESEKLTARFLDLPPEQLVGATEHVDILTSAELTKLTEDGTVAGWFDELAGLFGEMGTLPEPGKAEDYYLGDLYATAGKGKRS